MPIADAAHVRNATARFNQVTGVSGGECDEVWLRIRRTAKQHIIDLAEESWRELKR